MSKIVVGLFDNFEHARMAVEELIQNGFRREDVSLVASDQEGKFKSYVATDDTAEEMSEGAAAGAGIGAAVGGLGGLLIGLGLLTIPGIGPVLAAGPLVSALAGAGIGAAAGGLLGALVKAGIPEDQAEIYAEGVRRGGHLVMINTPDDMANRAVDILNHHNPVDVQKRAQEWRRGNWTGFDPDAQPMTSTDIERDRATYQRTGSMETSGTIPVEEEELRVGKREVPTGGVRVEKTVHEEPVEETVNLREEHVDVTRRPVDRPISPDDPNAFREGSIEVTGTAEEAVVDKQARIVEEIEVRKDVTERPETIRDTVRRTEVDIEETEGRGTMADYDEYDTYFRNHYNNRYANTTYSYDQYRPYYEYGYELGNNERYRSQNWDQVELEARRQWERDHPEGLWEEFKEAVREGWDYARGRR